MPATTAYYTSCHTLALHAALPIAGLDEAGMHDTADLLQQGIAASPRRGAVARQNPGIAREILERAHTVADQRVAGAGDDGEGRSEEHPSELQSLMRNSYAVFCLKKKSQHAIKH